MPPTIDTMLTTRRPFVLLEERLAAAASAQLYCEPVEVVRCDHTEEIAYSPICLMMCGS